MMNPGNPAAAADHPANPGLFAGLWDPRTRECALSFAMLYPAIIIIIAVATLTGMAGRELLLLGVVNIIAAVGLGLFSGTSGILSLGHVAFFGVGAYAASWFTLPAAMKSFLLADMPEFIKTAEWSLLASLPVAVLASLLAGAVTGLIIMRLRDTSAVIASFGFLVIAYLVFTGAKSFTNGKQSLYGLPTEEASWPLVLGALAVALAVAFFMKSTRYARHLEAIRDDEQAARSIGIEPQFYIFLFWVISAGMVGLAGALFVHVIGVVSPGVFYLEKTFALVVMIILGGYRSISGCVIGALVITVAEEIFRKTEEALGAFAGQETVFGFEFPQVFGLTAISFSILILIVLYLRPEGVMGYRELAYMRRRFLPSEKPSAEPSKDTLPHYRVSNDSLIETSMLSKSYRGLTALSDVGMAVEAGRIIALIGPNGAGKTTFINVLTGNLFASSGEIRLNHSEATLWSAHKLAGKGLGRTFQSIRLFDSLSALENVVCAINVKSPALSRWQADTRARAWLKLLGLEDSADVLAGNLAYGDQRRLEIARAMALEPQFLLLDEPVAGMNSAETEELKTLLKELVDRFGIGILLVEHDLKMVMQLSDQIYVLNKGELIASGAPAEIMVNSDVIEAYVGEESVEGLGVAV